MRKNIKTWLLTLLVLLISSPGYAQLRSGYRRNPFRIMDGLSITPKVGLNMFFGDLVDKSRSSYSVGVTIDREMSKFFSARGSLMGGTMKGTQLFGDTNIPYANFENFYIEGTIGGTYKPLNQLIGYYKERTLQPYLLLQLGLVYYNATEYWGEASLNTPGSVWREASEVAPIFGLGTGTSIWITPNISANLEIDGNLVFSDKMDGHDVWYGNTGKVYTTDPYDFYYTFTAGVSYLFNDSKWRNDPQFNRKTYQKTRKFFQSKTTRRKPSSHLRRRR